MKLTLLFRSKEKKLVLNINKQKLTLLLVAVCGIFLVSSRSTSSLEEDIVRIHYAKSGFDEQANQLDSLKTSTEQRMTGMMLKLAEIESQMQHLDLLGERLVAEANLNPEEFSFNQGKEFSGDLSQEAVAPLAKDDLLIQMQNMLEQIQNKSVQLNALESLMLSRHIQDESRLEGKPIESGWLSSYYGVRKDPFTGKPTLHKGLDFAGKEGEPVVSTGSGIVTWAGSRYGYGNLVEINHGNGLTTRYGHNKSLNVKIGDVVTKGQNIAVMGNTGRSTGAHVHYEVIRKGKQLDPLPFVYRKKGS
ncbi:M23 family metallopeptidase [Paraglaciecola marina]|uniref:M23 family metallopeptidase n=1 Tax=Paraglaciecola marina TaxID=2500157 RepID=UPI00105E1230|nr:M23 family metallopeptidase [Paraglaciecola marina]